MRQYMDSFSNLLTVSKCPVQAGAGSVVAAGEGVRGPRVPVSIEGNVEIELAPNLDVVGRVEVEMHTPGIGESGKEIGADRQVRPVKFVELHLAADPRRGYIFRGSGHHRLAVGNSLIR